MLHLSSTNPSTPNFITPTFPPPDAVLIDWGAQLVILVRHYHMHELCGLPSTPAHCFLDEFNFLQPPPTSFQLPFTNAARYIDWLTAKQWIESWHAATQSHDPYLHFAWNCILRSVDYHLHMPGFSPSLMEQDAHDPCVVNSEDATAIPLVESSASKQTPRNHLSKPAHRPRSLRKTLTKLKKSQKLLIASGALAGVAVIIMSTPHDDANQLSSAAQNAPSLITAHAPPRASPQVSEPVEPRDQPTEALIVDTPTPMLSLDPLAPSQVTAQKPPSGDVLQGMPSLLPDPSLPSNTEVTNQVTHQLAPSQTANTEPAPANPPKQPETDWQFDLERGQCEGSWKFDSIPDRKISVGFDLRLPEGIEVQSLQRDEEGFKSLAYRRGAIELLFRTVEEPNVNVQVELQWTGGREWKLKLNSQLRLDPQGTWISSNVDNLDAWSARSDAMRLQWEQQLVRVRDAYGLSRDPQRTMYRIQRRQLEESLAKLEAISKRMTSARALLHQIQLRAEWRLELRHLVDQTPGEDQQQPILILGGTATARAQAEDDPKEIPHANAVQEK